MTMFGGGLAHNGLQVADGGYTQTLKRSTDMENATNIQSEEQTGRLQQPAVSEWVAASSGTPPINTDDPWDARHGISKRVLTSGEFGMGFGTYFHQLGEWRVDGVTSSEGIKVYWWALVFLPPPVR